MRLRPTEAPGGGAAPGVANKANILGYVGSTGSGKSVSLKAAVRLARHARVLIWDPQDEYGFMAGQSTGTVSRLLELVTAAGRGPLCIRFLPSSDLKTAAKQFDAFCRIAYAAGHLAMVCEELAFVTTASHPPPGWMQCTLKGRHKGLAIYGTTQRPAKVDKDFFGGCTRVRCGRLNYATDQKVMADVIGVPREAIGALKPLEYFEKDMATGAVVWGVVNPTGPQPVAKPWPGNDTARAETGPPAKKKRSARG